MSCFSVISIKVLGQQKWAVEREKIQVRGPFETEESANVVLAEMESALAEAWQKARKDSIDVDYVEKLNGRFIGTPTFINKHFVTFNVGRERLSIFDLKPFDDQNIELIVGTNIDFKIIDGLVKRVANEAEHGRSR